MKINLKSFLAICVLLLSVIFQSCDKTRVFEDNQEIEHAIWPKSEQVEFAFNIEDTEQLYNLFINVRNKNTYPYSNLFLLVEMNSPDQKYFSDTLEFNLADKTGRWTGSGVGNMWLNQFPLFEGVKMLVPGTYQIKIGHVMRDDSLSAISDIGIRVETNE